MGTLFISSATLAWAELGAMRASDSSYMRLSLSLSSKLTCKALRRFSSSLGIKFISLDLP